MFRIDIKENGIVVGSVEAADTAAQIQSWADNGQWVGCTFDIVDITYEYELARCIENRIAEYPTFGDFLNVFFDGGDLEMEQLRQQRLTVKAKYPKPVLGGE